MAGHDVDHEAARYDAYGRIDRNEWIHRNDGIKWINRIERINRFKWFDRIDRIDRFKWIKWFDGLLHECGFALPRTG